MFRQLLTPVGDSLGLSFLIAILPVVAVLVLLGLLRRPAWQAALAGLIVGLIVAVSAWHMPIGLALNSVLNGAVFAPRLGGWWGCGARGLGGYLMSSAT